MAGLLSYALLCSRLVVPIVGQYYTPYETLPTAPMRDRPDQGNFTWPAGVTGSFEEGTQMTVRWNTSFRAVNLYVIFNHSVGAAMPMENQRQITTGNSDNSSNWNVSCFQNCNSHYVFRAVNTFGTDEEVLALGFWSRRFWIVPPGETSTTSTQSSSSITTTSSTSSAASSSVSPSTAATTPASSPSPVPTTNSTAIGAGVGAGVGGALFLLGAVFLWKHYTRKGKPDQAPQAVADLDPAQTLPTPEPKLSPYEAQSNSVFEAPAWPSEPQELPARDV